MSDILLVPTIEHRISSSHMLNMGTSESVHIEEKAITLTCHRGALTTNLKYNIVCD